MSFGLFRKLIIGDFRMQPNLKDVLSKLKETHSTSAGLKVRIFYSRPPIMASDSFSLIRLSVPGHAWRLSTNAGRVAVDMDILRE